jgi:acyl-coenzyme A thioesterase PaaI-like protein
VTGDPPEGTAGGHGTPDSYVRRMGLTFSTVDGRTCGRLPDSPALCSADGRLRLGAMAVLADCLSGYRALGDFEGAWVGTSDLAIHGPSQRAPGGVEAAAEILRKRRQGAVYEVAIRSGDAQVAVAVITLGLLSRQGEPKVPSTITGQGAATGPPGALGSLEDLLALEPAADGEGTSLRLDDGVRNSWGVVAGGVLALVVEAEAERVAGPLWPGPSAVEALGLHFLAPGRVGPIVARATLLAPVRTGTPPGAAHLRVRVHDAGADGRLVVAASATVVPSGVGSPVTGRAAV